MWLPLNEKTVGPFPPLGRVFFLTSAMEKRERKVGEKMTRRVSVGGAAAVSAGGSLSRRVAARGGRGSGLVRRQASVAAHSAEESGERREEKGEIERERTETKKNGGSHSLVAQIVGDQIKEVGEEI